MTKQQIAILAVLGLAVVCVLGFGAYIVISEERSYWDAQASTPQPAATRPPTPTWTPQLTDTPQPTDTPMPIPSPTEALKPTDTPTPTDTPIPIDTPTPIPTATPKPPPVPPTDTPEPAPEGPPPEVAAYMLEIMPKIQAISDSLTSLGKLLMDPKFGDDSWSIAVATNIVVIRETHKELTEVEVPPEVAEIHAAVLDATGDCSESMDYLTTGIDNMSIEDLETAVSLMNSCSEKSGRAAEMMEEYTAQFE